MPLQKSTCVNISRVLIIYVPISTNGEASLSCLDFVNLRGRLRYFLILNPEILFKSHTTPWSHRLSIELFFFKFTSLKWANLTRSSLLGCLEITNRSKKNYALSSSFLSLNFHGLEDISRLESTLFSLDSLKSCNILKILVQTRDCELTLLNVIEVWHAQVLCGKQRCRRTSTCRGLSQSSGLRAKPLSNNGTMSWNV